MSFPSELKYTKDHEWLKLDNDVAVVGITAFALEQLGDVVHLELPEVGEEFEEGDTFGTVESTKTVSDLYMPVSGEVIEVNNELVDDLDSLAGDTYNKGWFVKFKVTKTSEELLSSDEYKKLVEEA